MKKSSVRLICFFVVFIFSTLNLSGEIGIKGGLSLSNCIFGEDLEELDWKNLTGLQIGAFFSLNVSKNIRFQPEIYFAMKGTKSIESYTDFDIKYCLEIKLKLNYIELPVLLKIYLPMKGDFKPCFFFGPYGGLNLSAKLWTKGTIEYQGIKDEVEEEEDVKEDIKSFDYGVIIGAGIEYDLGSWKLILDVRYSLGLANIVEDDPDETIKNKAFVFMIGFIF